MAGMAPDMSSAGRTLVIVLGRRPGIAKQSRAVPIEHQVTGVGVHLQEKGVGTLFTQVRDLCRHVIAPGAHVLQG